MAFQLEFAADAERDFGLIFDHLLRSYLGVLRRPGSCPPHDGPAAPGLRRISDARWPGRRCTDPTRLSRAAAHGAHGRAVDGLAARVRQCILRGSTNTDEAPRNGPQGDTRRTVARAVCAWCVPRRAIRLQICRLCSGACVAGKRVGQGTAIHFAILSRIKGRSMRYLMKRVSIPFLLLLLSTAAATADNYMESPMLTARVSSGELPPVEETDSRINRWYSTLPGTTFQRKTWIFK